MVILLILFNQAIIIGCGSIGMQHALYLEKRCNRLIVIDPRIFSDAIFNDSLDSIKCEKFSSLEEFSSVLGDTDVVVISNWGPDHLQTLDLVSKKGARLVVLEKPCADSLQEIEKIQEICESRQIKLAVNQGSYYTEKGKRINQLAEQFDLGPVAAIWITGGARCLSTAGSHWLSLADQIFGSHPEQINGHAISHNINPRSEHLSYVEGVFSFLYSEGKRLGICLTNYSSVEGTIEIYWKNARGTLSGENLSIFSRNLKQLPEKITRYGNPEEELFDGKIPSDMQKTIDDLDELYGSLIKLSYSKTNENLIKHLYVARSIVLSLISSELGICVNFDSKMQDKYHEKKYLIS
jgi:predicted dehydrogenase